MALRPWPRRQSEDGRGYVYKQSDRDSRGQKGVTGRTLFLAAVAALLSLLGAACGDSGPAKLPQTGAEVCEKFKEADRFRYVFNESLESPKQDAPPDDSAVGGFANRPSLPSLDYQAKHDGAMVKPDRLDFQLSTPNQPNQPPLRTIRIANNEWFYLGDTWQVNPHPSLFPFTPPNLCDQLVSPLNLAGASVSEESVGDTQARHLRVEGAALEAATQIFGTQSDMGRLLKSFDIDLWLSKDKNRLLKLGAVSKATYPYGRELSVTFSLDMSSYNDKSIKIEPPL